MDKKIPPPRGEPFRFLGLMPSLEDLEWISQNVGMEEFREEIAQTIAGLPKQHMVRIWSATLDEMQGLRKKIRYIVYSLLMNRIPDHRFEELIHDVHSLDEDTFLALLDSHARHYFVLIPKISALVIEYDRILSSFWSRNMALASILSDHFGWPHETTDAREIIIAETLKRVRSGKGGAS